MSAPLLPGRSRVPIFMMALSFCAITSSVSTHAATLTFQQADWLSDFTGFTSQNSASGQVSIQFNDSDLSAFRFDPASSTYTGYVNVVTNVQNGASMNWAVQNLPVQFQGADAFHGSLADTVMFNLGVTPGVNVSSLDYVATINMDPLGLAPAGTFTTASVGDASLLFGGVDGTDPDTGTTFVGGTGRGAPPTAENFVGAQPGEKQGKGGQIAIAESDVAAIDEDKMGCVPAATARSIKYLQSMHKNVPNTDTAQDVYKALAQTMGSSLGDGGLGTTTDNLQSGKKKYDTAKKLPISTEKNGGIDEAIAALKKKKDVEVILKSKGPGGHCAFVSKIVPILDAKNRIVKYIISTIDDPHQGDGKAENEKVDYVIKPNREIISDGGFAKVDTFFIETETPEPSALTTLMIGAAVLLTLSARRRRRSA